MKVGYFLTDLPDPGHGQPLRRSRKPRRGGPTLAGGEQPEGASRWWHRAGDAIVFDRRLWHAASANVSPVTRVFVTVGYSYRWVRPKSAMALDALYPSLSPIRRQLLGAHTSANAWFDPTDDDVPLREWIRGRYGDEAVRP